MSAAQHTQDRLFHREAHFGSSGNGTPYVSAGDTARVLFFMNLSGAYGGNAGIEQARADARRLAACWNACDGLSTEALERLGTLDRANVARDVQRSAQLESEWVTLRELQRQCREAITQRDELLAELERMVRLVEVEDAHLANFGEVEAARSAIAKVKGSAS